MRHDEKSRPKRPTSRGAGPTTDSRRLAAERRARLVGAAAAEGTAVALERLEVVEGEAALRLVDVSHVLEDSDGLGVASAVEEKLRGFAKAEDEEAEDEDEEGDGADGEEEVAPAHVGRARAALGAIGDVGTGRRGSASVEVGRARVDGNEAEGDGAADYDANGLKYRQAGEKEALVLGDELEGDGGVDRNVTPDADTNECSTEDEEGVVVVGGTETEAEDRGNETGQVERPSAT